MKSMSPLDAARFAAGEFEDVARALPVDQEMVTELELEVRQTFAELVICRDNLPQSVEAFDAAKAALLAALAKV